jgi:hypothetical protein
MVNKMLNTRASRDLKAAKEIMFEAFFGFGRSPKPKNAPFPRAFRRIFQYDVLTAEGWLFNIILTITQDAKKTLS